ncbi:MAG TPA: ABC transporter permease [Gemmatimonadales bacterium]|nr:ABC transporter permease [Gemmatimonadales bacterium]
MKIPFIYNLRSIAQRPVSTAMTALGVALVVAVFVAMLALANGFRATLVKTGSPDNVIVLRRGATSEMESGLPRESARLIAADPRIAAGAEGRPLMSSETFVVINIPRAVGEGVNNVVARGVGDEAFAVRNVHIVAGRKFTSGRSEVILGKKIVPRFAHTAIGDTLRFAGRDWTVVGHFEASGSSLESEVWGEAEQFMPVFRGEVFQSIIFRLRDPAAFDEVKRALEGDQRLTVQAQRESAFYAGQSGILTKILTVLAVMITSIMAVGAVFGAVNTMYAAVASRTPEIAVLLTLGFAPRSVLVSFLAEAAAIAFLGGIAGALLALPINGIVTSTTNWNSFSEVAFAFRVTPGLLLAGVLFAVVMGLVGGFFPAWRAARLRVVQALR